MNNLQILKCKVVSISRPAKQLLAVVVDLLLCCGTVWLSFCLRYDELLAFSSEQQWAKPVFLAATLASALSLSVFMLMGLYRNIFRYSGLNSLVEIFLSTMLYGLLYASLVTVYGISGIPRMIGVIQPMLLLVFVAGFRVFAGLFLGSVNGKGVPSNQRPMALIYGAGSAGRGLASALEHSQEVQVCGFLDDDKKLQGHSVNGKRVFNPKNLNEMVERHSIKYVFLAIPSMSRARRNEIIEQMCKVHVAVRSLPNLSDLVSGRLGLSHLRELEIDDLLGREPVEPTVSFMAEAIFNKVILVTGAGGTIGSEICRQLIDFKPKSILMVENSEYALYKIYHELEKSHKEHNVEVVPLLANVQDQERIKDIIKTWQPKVVYHSAAYKHVPLVEHNVTQGVLNNVFGTLCTAQAAADGGVESFVLISTDKAVRPSNVMGASKRLAEIVLQAMTDGNNTTKFSIVRFGNVLGSSGSVVPRFRQQIRDGGPITLTHPEITRYFMTISEAVELVIQASGMASGGEVFVLDMGEPVKIKKLAYRMAELSGLKVKDDQNLDGDIELKITGLRPGEKLFEELLIGNNPEPTLHERIMKAREVYTPWLVLEPKLRALKGKLDLSDEVATRQLLQELVAGYAPAGDVVDWVYLRRGHNERA